jgi:hypothetical protein
LTLFSAVKSLKSNRHETESGFPNAQGEYNIPMQGRGFPTAWNYVTLLFSGLQIKRDIGYERSWKCDSFYGDGWALTAFLTSPKGNEQRKQEM